MFWSKPSKVYLIVQKTEYEDGTKTSQIHKATLSEKKAKNEIESFNNKMGWNSLLQADMPPYLKSAIVGLKIKRVYFDLLEHELE